jgi:hypothetical protein
VSGCSAEPKRHKKHVVVVCDANYSAGHIGHRQFCDMIGALGTSNTAYGAGLIPASSRNTYARQAGRQGKTHAPFHAVEAPGCCVCISIAGTCSEGPAAG